MKSLIYILLCFIAVNLSTATNINFENHKTRPKEGVDIATDDILTVKQEIEDEKLTEINYDIYWTAYKQRWLKYGKQRNTQRASLKTDSEKRNKRHVHESTIDDLFQNLKTERRNLLREKQDVISRKPSNETHQAWDAYKQKWNEYVKKWEEYEKRVGKPDKRDKRDVQATDGMSDNLETERRNLLKEKYDIINRKPNSNSTHQAWDAYKQKWNEYVKKWEVYNEKRVGKTDKRDKRDVQVTDGVSDNLKTERVNLLKEKYDIINRKPNSNSTHQAWGAYKQKWNEYVKKWEEYNEKREGKTEKRDKRDVQATDGVSDNLETERENLLKEKHDIINRKPNSNSTHQAWDAYKQKWNEYGKKWDESPENEGKSRKIDKRDVQDDGMSQNLQPERINLMKEKQDNNENNRFSIDWTAYKQRWLEYRKRWTAQHATLDLEIEREKRNTRDVLETKNDEEHKNLDNKRKQLIRQKAIINEQPERYDRDSKYGMAYKQKWEEYGNKWNAYHAGPEADKILGDRGRKDVESETGKWDEVGRMWKTYGQQWIGYGKKFEEFVAKKETERRL